MDYEVFYQEYSAIEKQLKDCCGLCAKLQKSIAKKMDCGDLKSAMIDMNALSEASKKLQETAQEAAQFASSFDAKGYFSLGDYATQMLDYCNEDGINAISDPPNFQIFPYKVRIDSDNLDVYIDKKKYSCFRPKCFVRIIESGLAKLDSSKFDAALYASELKAVYDVALLKEKDARPGSEVALMAIYKLLVPLRRFRKDYDMQAFAFDLARLYNESSEVNENSPFTISLGPGRKAWKLIRILDSDGNERFLGGISFSDK